MRNWWKHQQSEGDSAQQTVLGRLRSDSRGNTLAMLAASLVPIAAMVGSGLDMSRAYMAQAKLQNACDAAALAARREMVGNTWSDEAQAEGERFFEFNFPSDTMQAENLEYDVDQSDSDEGTVEVSASADIPTTVMSMFGKQSVAISVECDASQDYGNNDIMVVLDVTGSMNCRPGVSGGCSSEQSGSKIGRLRSGAMGLYRALEDATNTRTRFGFMPYSSNVNVGRDLNANWIRDPANYSQQVCVVRYDWWGRPYDDCHYEMRSVDHSNSWFNSWRGYGNHTSNVTSGCIEERSTIGNSGSPISISTSVSRDDIDVVSTSDPARQWAPYDPGAVHNESASYCPRPARRLATYSNESAFQAEVNRATAYVEGSTYHDIGMIWAMRYLSSTGMFAADNPTEWNDVPVSKHIVYLTDGTISVSNSLYSTYGIEERERRLGTSDSQNQRHVDRFLSACTRAKSMGMTVWVIALAESDTDDIRPCASSSEHFYTSDGTDLEEVFEAIGQGIGRLRLTR